MRLGIHLGNFGPGADARAIVELAAAAEDLGFDSVWVSDHVVVPATFESRYPYPGTVFTADTAETCFEPLVTLAHVAGLTSRVRVGTSVLIIPQRHALIQAKQLATIDALSGGRLDVGVWAGWLAEEFAALDAPLADRCRALDEWIEVFQTVWSEPEPAYQGRYIRFPPLRFAPKPLQPGGPPLTVGGNGPRSLRQAARAAGWHAFRLTPDELVEPIAQLRRLAEDNGRDPAALQVVLRCTVTVGTGPADGWSLTGTPGEIAAGIGAYRKVGVTTLIMTPAPGRPLSDAVDTLARVAADVIPLTGKDAQ